MNLKYPRFGRIDQLLPNPHIALKNDIIYTLKKDGSNTGIYFDEDNEIQIRSRRQDKAMFSQKVENLDVYDKIVEMMKHNKEMYNDDLIVFGELLSKGKSPTGLKTYSKDDFIVFDIYNHNTGFFETYNQINLLCHPFKVPVVPIVGMCNVATLSELYEFRDQMLDEVPEEEGVVGKIYRFNHPTRKENYLFVKEKNALPKWNKIKTKKSEDKIMLPQLERGETKKCIAKVYDSISIEDFNEVKIVMPLIAIEVKKECCEQNCYNVYNLFDLYIEKRKELLEAEDAI